MVAIPHWSCGARAWTHPVSESPRDNPAMLRHLAAHSSCHRLFHIGSSRFLLCFLMCANLSPELQSGHDGEVTQQMKLRSPRSEKNNKMERAVERSRKDWSNDTALPCAVFTETAFPFDLLLSFAETQHASQCLPPQWHWACNPLTAQISATLTLSAHIQRMVHPIKQHK